MLGGAPDSLRMGVAVGWGSGRHPLPEAFRLVGESWATFLVALDRMAVRAWGSSGLLLAQVGEGVVSDVG